MKYIKYYEEVNMKKAILGGALAATLAATSCKKDDMIKPQIVATDKVDDTDSSDDNKNTLYKITDLVNKLPKGPSVGYSVNKTPKKTKKVSKFKDFIKSKFKKSN